MKAYGVTKVGGPEALQQLELPTPEAMPGELRIRVAAAGVNALDALIRSGVARFSDAQPPYVPGADVAGVVDQIDVHTQTDLQLGDRVMAIVMPSGAHGGYAEYVTVAAQSAVLAPASVSLEQAATVPMNGLTARLALDTLGLSPGQVIAVTGAAGAVGGYVVQLAKVDGLRVIANVAADEVRLARQLGADIVVPRGAEWARRVREQVPAGVDGIVDTAGLADGALDAVRDGGTVISLRGVDRPKVRGIAVKPIMVFQYAREHGKLDRLRELVEAGALTPRVARVVPAREAAQAHQLLVAGGQRGRIVLTF